MWPAAQSCCPSHAISTPAWSQCDYGATSSHLHPQELDPKDSERKTSKYSYSSKYPMRGATHLSLLLHAAEHNSH